MIAEQTIRRRRWLVVIAVIVGFSLEFFLIPLPRQRDMSAGLLASGDFYYAIISPLVIWWWFAVFLRRRSLEARELGIGYLAFGFYFASALRAIAITIASLLH
jgi:hypothetical protein